MKSVLKELTSDFHDKTIEASGIREKHYAFLHYKGIVSGTYEGVGVVLAAIPIMRLDY